MWCLLLGRRLLVPLESVSSNHSHALVIFLSLASNVICEQFSLASPSDQNVFLNVNVVNIVVSKMYRGNLT